MSINPGAGLCWGQQAGAVFYKKSGLGPLPLALFNGVPLNAEEMDPDELETVILQRIMDTTNFFQRAVYMVRTVGGIVVIIILSICVHFICGNRS